MTADRVLVAQTHAFAGINAPNRCSDKTRVNVAESKNFTEFQFEDSSQENVIQFNSVVVVKCHNSCKYMCESERAYGSFSQEIKMLQKQKLSEKYLHICRHPIHMAP